VTVCEEGHDCPAEEKQRLVYTTTDFDVDTRASEAYLYVSSEHTSKVKPEQTVDGLTGDLSRHVFRGQYDNWIVWKFARPQVMTGADGLVKDCTLQCGYSIKTVD
jgi:hypothetical protein